MTITLNNEQLVHSDSDKDLLPHHTSTTLAQETRSYGQIVRSSSIIGGSQIINMLIGLVRIKLVAVLIGPSGIGLLSIYQSITGLATTIAGLGINTSGVRELALYHSKGDDIGVAKTVCTLRRVCLFTGVVGMLLLALLSPWISEISFGSRGHAWEIAALGLTILLGNITAGQTAMMQGTRRIADIARISIWGAVIGTVISVGIYWKYGIVGMIPALLVLAIVSLLVSSHYANKIKLVETVTSWTETWNQSRGMILFGVSMVVSGVMVTGGAYATRLLVAGQFGIVGVGIYSAAFSVSGIFVQFVLGAMGADFYPRLTAESDNHPRMSELINQQTEVGLLLSFPSLLATLVFAPWVINVLYTSQFSDAYVLLQWFVFGCIGRVLSWPLGYSLLAKGQSMLFIYTEVAFSLLHLALIWIGMKTMGLQGTAAAFALLYFLYTVSMLIICRLTISFRWSSSIRQLLIWMIPVVIAILILSKFAGEFVTMLIGGGCSVVCGLVCLRQLACRLGREHSLIKHVRKTPFRIFTNSI
jgi:antigen flippase